MNEVKAGEGSITITDPATGEQHTLALTELRAMTDDIAKNVPELGEVPAELRSLFAGGTHTLELKLDPVHAEANQDVLDALALKDAIRAPGLPVVEAPAQTFAVPKAQPRGLVSMNRKQRRAQEKHNRSKVAQKANTKRMEFVRKSMEKQIAEKKRLEAEAALIDVPFADPRHIGKIVKVFEPIEKALHNFHDGEVATMDDGTPLLWATEDGCWYPAVNCLRSVLETYSKLGKTHGWANHNEGLARVATLLENGEPIHKSDVDEALKTVEWMKYCTLTITPRQFTEEAVEVQISNEMRDAGLAPEPTDADLNGHAV